MDVDEHYNNQPVDSLVYSMLSFNTPQKQPEPPSRYSKRVSSFSMNHEASASRISAGSFLHRDFNVSVTDKFVPNLSATTIEAIDSGKPANKISKKLFSQFCELLRECDSALYPTASLKGYQDCCDVMVKKLSKLEVKSGTRNIDQQACISILQDERNTWQLIATLMNDRFQSDEIRGTEAMLIDAKRSDREIADRLMERDSSVREAQLIIDWLESCADVTMGGLSSSEKVEHFMDGGSAWENTFQYLETKRLQGGSTSGFQRHLVTELDPDAPTRQKRPLHDQDREDEQRLLRNVFEHIRRGHMEHAEKLAVQQGHFWLAAAFEGWRLHHDPNMNAADEGVADLQVVEGNPYRDLWKTVCWRMSGDNMVSQIERAIFAALSANLRELLPVCTSWEDKLWAYCRAYVDVSVEQELRVNGDLYRDIDSLPQGYPTQRPTMDEVFRNIQSVPELSADCKTFYHVVQRAIILNDISGLMEQMYERVRDGSGSDRFQGDTTEGHMLRFMAHLVLFLRRVASELNTAPREDFSDLILETYVGHLIEDPEKRHLVATYTAALPRDKQVQCYVKLLRRLGPSDREERERCLDLAREAGLDTALITKKLVTDVTATTAPDLDATSDSDTISEEDDRKIDALQWLLFDPAQRLEALQQANKLMRLFAACQKLQATQKVFRTLSPDTIDIVLYQARQRMQQEGTTEDDQQVVLPPETDNPVREYLCFQAYLEAHAAFNRWFEHFHGSKPKEPGAAPLRTQTNFTEWVAHEQLSKQYESDLAEWRKQNNTLATMAVDHLHNVLVFADGGWMVDRCGVMSFGEDREEETRQDQLSALRKLCLPQITFLLLTVRRETGQLQEAVRIADLIASEQHKLYACFSKQEIHTLLCKIKECCVDLLDQNLDPFGYSMD